MMKCAYETALLVLLITSVASCLQPDEILVIANRDNAASVQIARYYCEKRNVPKDDILSLSLGTKLNDTISRKDYEKFLAEPIRKVLLTEKQPGKIRCLLTTYGVPYKVEGRGPLKNLEGKLKELKESAEHEKNTIKQLEEDGRSKSSECKQATYRLAQLQIDIDRIGGKETSASVDSELSMVLAGDYELYRWQPNTLKNNMLGLSLNTLMVSRLDGPSYNIIKGLVDKALTAEQTGLKGIAYFDSRGLTKDDLYGQFDRSLRDLATLTRLQTDLPVVEETTEELFAPGSCPQTAIYCGWYSLKKYVDAFDFVDGAVGYHISSLEAIDIRDPNSTQWCPAMLTHGITATLGAVAEPYLHAFPPPVEFFSELFNGSCLVVAFYHTNPYNSWQFLLLGDPLYTPFKKHHEKD
jgi:uncharacterized protein (TIGR03790 family)